MKTVTRICIKIIGAPFIIFFMSTYLLIAHLERIYHWAYDASELDRYINAKMREDLVLILKKWFTQL
jgi:hypothetical protein